MSCFKRKVSWFLVGVGVGTVVSLLAAPVAGENLQEQMASSAREVTENATRRSRQAVETLGDFADRGREKINEAVNAGQDAVNDANSQWKGRVDRGRDVIS
jgi:gas vesicle protein